MRICPSCQKEYPDEHPALCSRDGQVLVPLDDTNDPMIGRTLGRFTVVSRAGTGGMGTVYRAEQAGLSRQVALKVLKTDLSSDRETVARFHREAKAMSLLVHPNTVRVFDFGEAGGHLYLAMELLEGELLSTWMERVRTPPIRQAIQVGRELLRSLSEAHRKGIIHRDLKPDNIFLARVDGQPKPVVKVLDFGIAKAFTPEKKIDELETQAGTVFGTPRYMSPEQAQGKDLDGRSDLYSVGVLLYELLAGRPPFVDDNAVMVMAKHIRERPVPLRQLVPERPIPKLLEDIVLKALAKRREERFDDAQLFQDALTEALPEVELARQGKDERAPWPAILFGAAVVSAAIFFAGYTIWSSAPETPLSLRSSELASATTTRTNDLPARDEAIAGEAPREPEDSSPAVLVQANAVDAGVSTQLLRSEPEGATVWENGERLGTTPLELVALDGRELVLSYTGYRSREVRLPLASDEPIALPRRRRSRPSEQRSSTGGASSEEPYERFD